MIYKLLVLTLLLAPAAATAQTTATAEAETPTTRVTLQRNALFTTETIEDRLAKSQALYEKAGIPAEKIEKMRELDEQAFSDQARGRPVNYIKIRQERRRILTPEEMQKLHAIQKEMALEGKTTGTETP